MGDLEIGHWNFWVVFGQIFGFFGFTVYINPTKKYDQLLWCFFLAFVFFCWNFWMRPPLGAVWWWKRWGKAVLVEQYLQVNMTKPQKCIYFFSEIRNPSKSSCICIKFDPHPHKSGKLIEWPFWNHGGKSSEWKMYDIDGAGKGYFEGVLYQSMFFLRNVASPSILKAVSLFCWGVSCQTTTLPSEMTHQ